MDTRNAQDIGGGRIDCDINHPIYGWIPYTIDPSDTDQTIDNVALLEDIGDNVAPYVAPEPVPYVPSDLSPRRFEYLLAYTGLDDVWAALEAELKVNDRALFAQIKAQRNALSFQQAKTLAIVSSFADIARRVAPDADLSETAIMAAWVVAEGVNL